MKVMRRTECKWITDNPPDLLRWMWGQDGQEAVIVDGTNYYCGTLALIETYQTKWAAEGKANDPRQALPFASLPLPLDCPDHTQSAAWCAEKQFLCSEIGECDSVGC